MIDDVELLRRYAEQKSEAAFAELVRRRIDLVYSVALRQVGGDAHLAEDVAQKVFADLARKAASLTGRAVLSGWLYRSTHYAASDVVRSERRRRAREQESQIMHEASVNPNDAADWDKLRPLLDEAMGDLSEDDRDAVALRYFEGRAFADIGRALRLTEEAARKRVDRALDKMGAALSRRGVTSTSAALGVALAQQATCAAPAGLAASVAGSALAGATAAGGVAAGAAVVAFMSSMKATVGAGVVAALAIGGAIYEMKTARARDAEIAALTQQRQTIQANLADVQQRLQAAEKRAAAAEDDNAKLLTAIRNQSAARTAAVTQGVARPEERQPITRDAVEARYRRAQELAKTGDPALALEELLWCFDEGMVGVTGYGGVRMSFLLSHIAKLGERHPPALAALRERRDKAEKRVWVSENDYDAASTFGAINRVLNEPERTLAILDQLPAGDRRRRTLASSAADHLIEAKRYGDAMEGRPYDGMVRLFDSQQRPNLPPDRGESVVAFGAKNVEILAGAGDVERAREFAEKILAFDASPETRALLEKHAARAGQPELLRGR